MDSENSEKEDWIKSLIDLEEQLERLEEQLRELDAKKYNGIIGRSIHARARLGSIKNYVKKLP